MPPVAKVSDRPAFTPVSLPETLWRRRRPLQRSLELSPICVDRYAGPRKRKNEAERITHAYWELVFVFSGKGVHCGRANSPLDPYSAVLIPPGLPHDEAADGRFDTLWVGLQGSRFENLPVDSLYYVHHAPGVVVWAEKLWLANERRHDFSGPELDGLTLVLFGEFFRALESEIAEPSDRLDAALRFIHEHLAQPFSVADLARHARCSEAFLHREFRRRLKITPANYVRDARIRQAMRLMRDARLSVNEAAHRSGFLDARVFRRVCQRLFKCTPCEALQHHVVSELL